MDVDCSGIYSVDADAIVSPANSFGFMDGGIDLVYVRRFGWGLQTRLQDLLADQWGGELPVGQAVIVPTTDESIPWLVSAPTMRVPENVSQTVNAYLAFRAALIAVTTHNASAATPIRTMLCPGLATGIGGMPAELCARQMKQAWDYEMGTKTTLLHDLVRVHRWMKGAD